MTLYGVLLAVNLKEFLKTLPSEAERDAFAGRCETSLGHLRNVMYGYKPCGPELAVCIERESNRVVTRIELCPATWHRIWPELAAA